MDQSQGCTQILKESTSEKWCIATGVNSVHKVVSAEVTWSIKFINTTAIAVAKERHPKVKCALGSETYNLSKVPAELGFKQWNPETPTL